jgi:hypothetical protein
VPDKFFLALWTFHYDFPLSPWYTYFLLAIGAFINMVFFSLRKVAANTSKKVDHTINDFDKCLIFLIPCRYILRKHPEVTIKQQHKGQII